MTIDLVYTIINTITNTANERNFYMNNYEFLKKTNIILAPMAGCTDYAFRKICKSKGATYLYTEMISAKALWYKDEKTKKLLFTDPSEKPIAVQLFGHDPAIMAYGAKTVRDMGYEFIDINAGCPVPKIVNNGEGSALMNNPKLLYDIVKSVVDAVDVPVSVKLRAGWDSASLNAPQCAKLCEEAGASFIAIHGRTREMYYKGSADREIIKKTVDAVNIPVGANGDVFTPDDAVSLLKETGAVSVMIGRGALGNPWIFGQVSDAMAQREVKTPSLDEKIDMAIYHLNLLIETKGEFIGVREARHHISYYIKGIKNAAAIRNEINMLTDPKKIIELLCSMKRG